MARTNASAGRGWQITSGLLSLAALLLISAVAQAQTQGATRSAASLLPEDTKGYVSVPNVNALLEAWDDTQIGHLLSDKQLRPFVDQILERVRNNGSTLQLRLGISLSDLRTVSGGEVCLAALQPAGEESHAIVVICDVQGRANETRALMVKSHASLHARQATQQTKTMHKRQVTMYTIPGPNGRDGHQVFYAVNQQRLIVTDHVEAMNAILARSANNSLASLEDQPAFQKVHKQTALEGVQSHLSWYVEPFGYARSVRAAVGQRKRGTDMLKLLQLQGFDALEAVGGQVALKTKEHEVLHRTMVYAPKEPELAARMLDFPAGEQLHPEDWVPANVSNYVSFRWQMANAFEYSESLVNAVAKSEDFFQDFLQKFEQDPKGPQINLRRDLIAHLGDQITFISDMQQPVTPKSDRFLIAVEVTDTEAVARTVSQTLEPDPTAKPHEMNGLTIWEIINESEAEDLELNVDVEVDGNKFNFGKPRGDQSETTEEAAPSLPNSAIAVVEGKLLIASHVELIVQIAQQLQQSASQSLNQSDDYQRVSLALDKLSAGGESFRVFSRSDETYHATYELIRQGRVGESESLVSRLLNRLNGEKASAKHMQKIDGSTLPAYDYVRKYLGPSGAVVETQADGWMISGFILSQDAK